MTTPSDRSASTLPNLVQKNAWLGDVALRIAETGEVDEVDFKGWTGLHWALVREVPDVIALLLESGADPNHPTGTGRLPLVIAMRSGQRDAVKMLLESGADPERADSDGQTPRDAGRVGKYPELIEILENWESPS
jgi:ankyrin repeat protein